MNRIYKRIWNAARGCWVVVSEAAGIGQTRGCGKKAVAAAVVCLMAGMSGGAWATGGVTPEPVDTDLPDPDKPEDFSTKWSGDFTPEMKNLYLTGPKRIEVKYENEKTKLFSGPLPSSLKGMHLQAHQSLVNLGSTYGIAGNFENKGRYYTGSQTLSNSDHEHASGTTELLDASYPGTFDNYGTVFSGANGFKVGYGCFINEARGVIKAIAWPNNDAYSFVLTGKGRLTNAGRITTSEDEILQNTPIKNASAFLQSGGELDNVSGGVLEAIGGTTSQGGPAYTLTEGVLTNEAGGSIVVVAGGTSFLNGSTGKFDTDAGVGFKFEGGTINNKGQIDINQSGNPMNLAFVQTGGELTNSGILNSKGGNEYFAHGYSLLGGTLTNTADGIINAVGRESECKFNRGYSSGINVSKDGVFNNYGVVNANGNYAPGISVDGVINNFGTVNAGVLMMQAAYGLLISGQFNNSGRLIVGDRGLCITSLGARLENEGIIDVTGSRELQNIDIDGVLYNGADGVINIGTSDEDGYVKITGYGEFENAGTVNIRVPSIYALDREVIWIPPEPDSSEKPKLDKEGKFIQSASTARINGNLLAFAELKESSTVAPMPTNYLVSNTKKLDDVSFSGTKSTFQIGEMASFLQSGITGGTIHVTDDDWAASVQQAITEAIYGTGVGKDVAITFAGTGTRGDGFTSGGYTVAATESFLGKGNAGAILYESDLVSEKPNLVIGNGGDITKSFGYRTITGTDTITVKDGLELTLVGKGENDYVATGALTLAGGTLNLGVDNAAVTLNAGKLKDVTFGEGGKLNVVKGNYTIENAKGTIGYNGFKLAAGTTLNLHGNDLVIQPDNNNDGDATGGYIGLGGVVNNHGRLTANGGAKSFEGAGLRVIGKLNNYGTIDIFAKRGLGAVVDGGELTNYGSVTTFGDLISAPPQPGTGTLLPTSDSGFSIQTGKFINKSGSVFMATGGHSPGSTGISVGGSSTFVNEDGAEVIAAGGEGGAWGAYGFVLSGDALFVNAGKLTLQATKAVSNANRSVLNAFYGSNLKQAESSASISGNLLSFADYQTATDDVGEGIASIGGSDTSAFIEVTSDGGINQLASFLGSGISGGTIHITDTDFSASAQQTIKDAIYGTGVGSGVTITFGGTGNLGFEGKKKVIDIAHARNFLKTAANVGAILYQDDLADTTAMRVGSGSSDLDSIGFRSVNSKVVSIAGGKALTLLGDGTKLAGDATGSVTIADGTLNLGYQHELTKSQKQGGVLGNVSVAKTGVMSVAAVDGLYEIGEKLTLAENAKVKNAGKLVINTLSLTGKNTSIRNDGTMTVSAVDGSSSNRTTVQNTGVLSVDSTKNLSIQNKGTVVANEVSIGALDRVENGGTLVADKFKSNGVLINRGNGQLVIGIVAKVSYLTKHLEVAKEMYDAGETLPEAVIEALKSAGMIPADAAANVAALIMLTDDERALPDEAEEAASLSADEGEGEETAASESKAPIRTIEDLIRESRERVAREAARVHRTIPTTVGALTSAARGAASQTMATIESQANATVAGLWADAGYGKTEFDAYRTDRSGLLFGVQGSTETLTLGAVLSAGTGNVKSDNLASQDWNDVGGSVYGAYRFGPAALTASALYERHEGKAQGQKRHADVLGASAKVSVDAMLGGMTVTPYAGWRVLGLDHEDAANRVVVHELPVGIKAVGSFEAGSWRISPSADVAYVPTFGDKKIRIDGTNTKSVVAGDNAMTYRVGISAEKNRLSLGLSYVGTTGDCGLRGHSVRGNLRFAF